MPREKRPIPQAAVLAFRAGEVCVVTARSGKGWVLPKGSLEPGLTLAETALQEAWEEAGLIGFLHDEPLGRYAYQKNGNLYVVTVFIMEVTQVRKRWPEIGERERAWVPADGAHRHVHQPELRALLRRAIQPDKLSAPSSAGHDDLA